MIYLDYNATTPPAAGVAEAMTEAMRTRWANPSSVHRAGQDARAAVELARRQLAGLVNGKPRELTLTGSGTEAIDLAIRGRCEAWRRSPAAEDGSQPIVITTAVEHAAIRDLLEDDTETGRVDMRTLSMDAAGVVVPESLDAAIGDDRARVAVVSVQWANNETGAIQPIAALGERCRAAGVAFHTDATQWVGKMPTDLPGLPIDIATFSPHKFGGPKGVGVLWSRRGVRLRPRVPGSQELGRRGGTENVPGIVGAGVAAQVALEWLSDDSKRAHIAGLRDRLQADIIERCAAFGMDVRINGPTEPDARLWNTTNLGFPRLEAEAILLGLSERGVCASAGAACSSGSLDPSPVLLAMGIEPAVAHGSVRFSLGPDTTEAEVAEAGATVAAVIENLSRTLTPA